MIIDVIIYYYTQIQQHLQHFSLISMHKVMQNNTNISKSINGVIIITIGINSKFSDPTPNKIINGK